MPGWKMVMAGSMAGAVAGVVGNPGGEGGLNPVCWWLIWLRHALEIIMVRMQGDFAKAPEKRLGYKNCFDGLFRVGGSQLDLNG